MSVYNFLFTGPKFTEFFCLIGDKMQLIECYSNFQQVDAFLRYSRSKLKVVKIATNFGHSRRFQEEFQEKSRTCLHCFGLLCNVPNLLVCLNMEQKHDMHNMGVVAQTFIMTGNQCSRSSTFYIKISRKAIQIQGDFQDFQVLQTPCHMWNFKPNFTCSPLKFLEGSQIRFVVCISKTWRMSAVCNNFRVQHPKG